MAETAYVSRNHSSLGETNSVGADEGCELGLIVGGSRVVGWLVGCSDGCDDGCRVGCPVGLTVFRNIPLDLSVPALDLSVPASPQVSLYIEML